MVLFITRMFGEIIDLIGIVCIAHKVPNGLHPDSYALKILYNLLVVGKNSRLYKSLVDKVSFLSNLSAELIIYQALATRVDVSSYGFRDNGLFESFAFLTPVRELVLS